MGKWRFAAVCVVASWLVVAVGIATAATVANWGFTKRTPNFTCTGSANARYVTCRDKTYTPAYRIDLWYPKGDADYPNGSVSIWNGNTAIFACPLDWQPGECEDFR